VTVKGASATVQASGVVTHLKGAVIQANGSLLP
jgi:hypothetical protein